MRDRPDRLRVMTGGGVAIMSTDGRLLLVHQEHDGVQDWGYVGGALEAGESIQDCVIREAREETGLAVRLERLLSVTEYWQDVSLQGIGFLFLAFADPWPQEVVLPERDGPTLFLGHRWIDQAEFEALSADATYDFGGLPWPPDVRKVIWRISGRGHGEVM